MTRAVMWLLLGTVAAAAAVLSFSALQGLAVRCGFSPSLAALLPVVIDAGAGLGCLVWLGTESPRRALRFARSLTWALLTSSVVGNAVDHYLGAYTLRPAWWLVVIVSAAAPAVLGAAVHLAVLLGREPAASNSELNVAPTVSPSGEVSDRPQAATGAVVPPAVPVAPKPSSVPQGTDSSTKSAGAIRAQRKRERDKRHGAGDHTMCLPGNCPHVPNSQVNGVRVAVPV